MRIAIFGCGSVGLVAAACFAQVGHQVICVDLDQIKINNLHEGLLSIHEPGLNALIVEYVAKGALIFTTNAQLAISHSDLLFITVGTPSNQDGSVCLDSVFAVAKTIGQTMDGYKLIINKSTVPVGTAYKVKKIIETCLVNRQLDLPFDVASNPEFLKEGSAIYDFMYGDRIVIGIDSPKAKQTMVDCYQSQQFKSPLIFMSTKAAELTKYAANAMLATKISFINEIANIAERLGVDIEDVRRGIATDKRIGFSFINPGCGYGGSCLSKDIKALIHSAASFNYQAQLLQSVEAVNERQQHILFEKLYSILGGHLKGKTIAILGLAFKADTSDIRKASSLVLIRELWEHGVNINVYDPEAMGTLLNIYGYRQDLCFATSALDAIAGAAAMIVCTEWEEFKGIDLALIKLNLAFPLVIDGRNLYDPVSMHQHGLLYYGVGRGNHQDKSDTSVFLEQTSVKHENRLNVI